MHCCSDRALGIMAGIKVGSRHPDGRLPCVQAVLRLAKLHDDLLSAKDPVLTLRLAGAFCILALLSNVFR